MIKFDEVTIHGDNHHDYIIKKISDNHYEGLDGRMQSERELEFNIFDSLNLEMQVDIKLGGEDIHLNDTRDYINLINKVKEELSNGKAR